MRQTWSIGWFERDPTTSVIGSRRGTFRFTSPNASRPLDRQRNDGAVVVTTYRVVPRTVPVRSLVSQSPMIGRAERPGACTKTHRCSPASGRTSRAISCA